MTFLDDRGHFIELHASSDLMAIADLRRAAHWGGIAWVWLVVAKTDRQHDMALELAVNAARQAWRYASLAMGAERAEAA